MKRFTIILFILAVALCAFGYWGAFTKAGEKHYEEMAGMIPFFALITGLIFLAVAILCGLVLYIKRKKSKEESSKIS